MASGPAPSEETPHRLLVRFLVVAASVLALLSIFTTWLDRQALDTDQWVDTSGRMLEDRTISDAVANYAVDELFNSVNVTKLLREKLPSEVKPLAAPAAGGLREFAVRAAQSALQTPRLQGVWRDANRTAHINMLAILEDRSDTVTTANGKVVLNLRPVVKQLADRLGIDKQLSEKLPQDAAQLEVLQSKDLETARTVTRLLKGLAIAFSLGTLALFALAAYLARGRRWLVVFGYGIGLIISGIAALALRKVGSELAVDQLASSETARIPVQHALAIGTDLLSSIATTVIATGVLFVIASFLASPTSAAVSIRRALAPTFIGRPALVWGGFAGLLLIYLIVFPPQSSRELYSTLALVALAVVGLEGLNRKIRGEFPEAKPGDVRERVRERVRELGAEGAKRTRAAFGDLTELMEREHDEEDKRLLRLEKLGQLREKGVLTAAEFKAEKRRLLQGNGAAPSKPAAKRKTPTATKK
jgi:hypothetical protein